MYVYLVCLGEVESLCCVGICSVAANAVSCCGKEIDSMCWCIPYTLTFHDICTSHNDKDFFSCCGKTTNGGCFVLILKIEPYEDSTSHTSRASETLNMNRDSCPTVHSKGASGAAPYGTNLCGNPLKTIFL